MWSRVSAWSLFGLLALACGSTGKSGQPPPSEGIAGASGGPGVEEVDTSGYRWGECGRIAPNLPIRGANYASDGSVVTVESSGRVRLFPADSNVATTLVPDQGLDVEQLMGVGISRDGTVLLAAGPSGRSVLYGREDGAAITAGTGELVALDTVDAEAESCDGALYFSPDSPRIATSDQDTVCLWESLTGSLSVSFALEANEGVLLPDETLGEESFLAVRNDTLLSFDLQGELAESFELSSLIAGQRSWQTAFSPDGRYLLLSLVDEPWSGMSRLLAIDTASGTLAWERLLTSPTFASFTISRDATVVLAKEGPLLGLSDGRELGHDVPDFFQDMSILGPGGQRTLRVGSELVAEWDVEKGELVRMYGAHTDRILDLDISPDGRHFASHGRRAVAWQVDAQDFSLSLPLFQGAAPDESWNVAIDSSGEVMSVSGDNVMLFKRRGEHWYSGFPPAVVSGCGSADWSFSPLGDLVAGSHYGNEVELVTTSDFSGATRLEASNCWGGVAFSPDGSQLATASLELFETATWTKRWKAALAGASVSRGGEDDVAFSPDGRELVATRCPNHNLDCVATRYRSADGGELGKVPGLSGEQVRYSPDGNWLISKGDLVYLPTGAAAKLPAEPQVAVFTPEGDIIAGELDGSLVRYCQQEPHPTSL